MQILLNYSSGFAAVSVTQEFLSLTSFDFASHIAPTIDQALPLFATSQVYVAAGGESAIIDPMFDWIFDSGCTSHMCNNRDLFTELRPFSTTITTAELPTKVSGIGTVRIRCELPDKITNLNLLNKSPMEMWDGNTPDVSKLRVFKYKMLTINKSPTNKFAPRTWDGIYLGPAALGDGNKIYNPLTKKTSSTRNVTFMEDKGKPIFHKVPTLPGDFSELQMPESTVRKLSNCRFPFLVPQRVSPTHLEVTQAFRGC